jgi:hypothetical protein
VVKEDILRGIEWLFWRDWGCGGYVESRGSSTELDWRGEDASAWDGGGDVADDTW